MNFQHIQKTITILVYTVYPFIIVRDRLLDLHTMVDPTNHNDSVRLFSDTVSDSQSEYRINLVSILFLFRGSFK